ncbi:hypothetical protein [Azohydromonas lata]|uniref:hypothetical protein n=1 Tax=Azohydromonas lata TaxID=45677 RepID=UPI00082F0347|nr:hypothetical protein [Azohydromonas lata]
MTRPNVAELERIVVKNLRTVRDCLEAPGGSPAEAAMTELESFADAALRLCRASSVTRLRESFRAVAIKAHLDVKENP